VLHLSPDAAIVLLTTGLVLIYWELNRPGLIIPGACGLLATLLAIAQLIPATPTPALITLLLAATLLLLSTQIRLSILLEIAATLAIIAALWTTGTSHHASTVLSPCIHRVLATVCGTVIGLGSLFLTRIARRARQNKSAARV
jgi:membrane-bound ClpP family serine protease